MKNQVFNTNTLGGKLKQLRDQRNLKQREIGAVINVDGAFISKVENNDKSINRNHLPKLSKFFNIEEDELQSLWLADKIRLVIKEESLGKQAVEIVLKDYKNINK